MREVAKEFAKENIFHSPNKRKSRNIRRRKIFSSSATLFTYRINSFSREGRRVEAFFLFPRWIVIPMRYSNRTFFYFFNILPHSNWRWIEIFLILHPTEIWCWNISISETSRILFLYKKKFESLKFSLFIVLIFPTGKFTLIEEWKGNLNMKRSRKKKKTTFKDNFWGVDKNEINCSEINKLFYSFKLNLDSFFLYVLRWNFLLIHSHYSCSTITKKVEQSHANSQTDRFLSPFIH